MWSKNRNWISRKASKESEIKKGKEKERDITCINECYMKKINLLVFVFELEMKRADNMIIDLFGK